MGRSSMSRPHNRSGRQRWWISFQDSTVAPAESPDGNSQIPTTTWTDFGDECDAEIVELFGQKRIVEGQPQIEQRYRITCRWQPGIRANMRIVWPVEDGPIRIFNIESAIDTQSLHQELSIIAVELTPEE